MNTMTGMIALPEELSAMKQEDRDLYTPVPRHMHAAAMAAHADGDSLFSGNHGGQRVKSQALALARKAKAKKRRKIAQASKRRNR